jgi:hypothetical protein
VEDIAEFQRGLCMNMIHVTAFSQFIPGGQEIDVEGSSSVICKECFGMLH